MYSTYMKSTVNTICNYARGPRIKASFVIPSYGLRVFSLWEEKVILLIQYYTIYSNQSVGISNEQILTVFGLVAFSARVWTSLHSSPKLRINCPVSHKPLVPPLPLIPPLNTMYPHILVDTVLKCQKMTSAHSESSWSDTHTAYNYKQ